MNLTSSSYFLFLIIILIPYYGCERLNNGRIQKYVLLIASLYFYLEISRIKPLNIVLLLCYIVLITYFGAIGIEKSNGWKKKFLLFFSVFSLAIILFITKYAFNLFTLFSELFNNPRDFSLLYFGSIAGISYFVLSAIGYLADVYMEIADADRDIVSVSLFVLFFPQIVSGPITRFNNMIRQFHENHRMNYDGMMHAIRRMTWGYFKKLVISERFAAVSTTVYSDYLSYSGIGILFATLCYAVQIYTDFSGCMDIVVGTSGLFGIELPENFRAPFLSTSYKEFYQRWHISLGTWFKDYVMYPIQKGLFIQRINTICKKMWGNRGKKISFYISMLVLWIGIGIWHGCSALYFMVSTIFPFTVLVISDILKPFFSRITSAMHINSGSFWWRSFQMLRTILVTCFIFLFICAGGVHSGISVLKHGSTNVMSYDTIGNALSGFDLKVVDVCIMLVGLSAIVISDICIYNRSSIFEVMDKQNSIIRRLFWIMEFFLILLFGIVGKSPFIYFQF